MCDRGLLQDPLFQLTTDMTTSAITPKTTDPINELLTAHGLRRTMAARQVLGWLLAHPDTSYTHAQLQAALAGDASSGAGAGAGELDRVTLYRLIDRLTQVGLLLCRVDASRTRRYQAMPAEIQIGRAHV